LTKWSTDTAATRKTAGVDVSSNVSSFAIVVDMTTKAKIGGSVYIGTSPVTQVNTVAAPLLTGASVGLIGNIIGFWIQNGTTTTTTLHGFYVANKVTKLGVANTAATEFGIS